MWHRANANVRKLVHPRRFLTLELGGRLLPCRFFVDPSLLPGSLLKAAFDIQINKVRFRKQTEPALQLSDAQRTHLRFINPLVPASPIPGNRGKIVHVVPLVKGVKGSLPAGTFENLPQRSLALLVALAGYPST